MAHERAVRRYVTRVWGSLIFFGATLGLALSQFDGTDQPTGVLAIFLAALPALGLLGVFGAVGGLVFDIADEFQRGVFAKQAMATTAITLAFGTIWGFLERFGQAPHLTAFYVLFLWMAVLALTTPFFRIRV